MKFKLHNKVEIISGDKCYVFFNTMLKSVFIPLSNLREYNKFVAVGCGKYNQNEKTQKLTKFIKKYTLKDEVMQNDLEKGRLFIKKSLVINDDIFGDENITELGFCEDSDNNPTIYNYITLVSEKALNGIEKKQGEALLINLYIYLDLSAEGMGLFCKGENKLISFLLGEGLNEEIYAVRGCNFSENTLIFREYPQHAEKFLASFSFEEGEYLSLQFKADLKSGETDEIVFVCGEKAVARINVLNQKSTISKVGEYVSLASNVIDIGSNVESVSSVINVSSNKEEIDYFLKKYANDFADEITVPFGNLFDYQTPRFLSKDGQLIFFVKNDYIYGYKNLGYQITKILTGNLSVQHIRKVVAFDRFVFVITKTKPFLHCYQIIDNKLVEISLDIKTFEYYNSLDSVLDIDLTMSSNGKIMLAIILSNGNGVTAYFDFDAENNLLIYDTYLLSEYQFSYLLAMYKNNFSDARVMFLKGGEYSFDCRIVTHYADKTINDIATILAYDLTHETKQVYVKNRAIIVEKTFEPRVYIYYFPNGERYNLSLIQSEVDDYFSEDLLYLIQKYSDSSFKIFNIVGYDNTCEFKRNISDMIDADKIKDFEFLGGALLVFSDDEAKPISCFGLKQNQTIIENLKESNATYQVSYKTYDKVGKNNEGVKAIIKIVISL